MPSSLTDERLGALYVGEGFGGDNRMRTKAGDPRLDEIRTLRAELVTGIPDPIDSPPGEALRYGAKQLRREQVAANLLRSA